MKTSAKILSAGLLGATAIAYSGEYDAVNFVDFDISGVDFTSDGRIYDRGNPYGSQNQNSVPYLDLDLSYGNFDRVKAVGTVFYGKDLNHADFSGADLSGSDLRHANLSGALLTDISLTGAFITGANLSGLTAVTGSFTQDQFESTYSWRHGELSGVTLSNNLMKGWNFSGKDLTGAVFDTNRDINTSITSLESADFSGAVLTGASFRGANVLDANFSNSGLTKDQLMQTIHFTDSNYNSLGSINLDGLNMAGIDFSGKNAQEASFAGTNFAGANFREAVISRSNLDGADLRNADFTGASIANSTLAGARISGANLSGMTAVSDSLTKEKFESTYSWQHGELSGVTLSNNLMKGWNFSGKDLTGAVFDTNRDINTSRTSLENADLTGAVLTGASFRGANVLNANFSNSGLTKDQLMQTIHFTDSNYVNLGAINLSSLDLRGIDFSGRMAIGASFAGTNLSGSNFRGATVQTSDLSGANLRNVDFTKANLTGSDFSGAYVNGANFSALDLRSGTTFQGLLQSTASWADGDLSGIRFSTQNMSGWNLSGKNLAGAIFDSDFSLGVDATSLRNADLTGANLAGASFMDVNMTGSKLNNADLTGADLRGATLTNANMTGATMKNTIGTGGIFVNFSMDGDSLRVGKYTGKSDLKYAYLTSNGSVSNGSRMTLESGAGIAVMPNGGENPKLSIGGSTVVFNANGVESGDAARSTTVENSVLMALRGGQIEIGDGTVFEIMLTGDFAPAEYIMPILIWDESSEVAGIERLTKNQSVFLFYNGEQFQGTWNLVRADKALGIAFSTIPEPASAAAFLGAAALGLAAFLRRRSNALGA